MKRTKLLYREGYDSSTVFAMCSLADPGFGRGGAENVAHNFADVVQQSRASEASVNWPGSRAHLRALEALAFLSFKYAFSWFSWHLLLKF